MAAVEDGQGVEENRKWAEGIVPYGDRGVEPRSAGGTVERLLHWQLRQATAAEEGAPGTGKGDEVGGEACKCEKHPTQKMFHLTSWPRSRHAHPAHGADTSPQKKATLTAAAEEHGQEQAFSAACEKEAAESTGHGHNENGHVNDKVLTHLKEAMCKCGWHVCDACHLGFMFPFPSAGTAISASWATPPPQSSHPEVPHVPDPACASDLHVKAHSWPVC